MSEAGLRSERYGNHAGKNSVVDCIERATKRNTEDVGDGLVLQLATLRYYSP